jgi:general stress protein 26
MSGTATTTANDDPRIKDVWTRMASIWFSDLGDGVHTGKPDDPRMALIEFTPGHAIVYQKTVSALGFAKEAAVAVAKGEVAETGVLRELSGSQLEMGGA